jgi:hypothetical protein
LLIAGAIEGMEIEGMVTIKGKSMEGEAVERISIAMRSMNNMAIKLKAMNINNIETIGQMLLIHTAIGATATILIALIHSVIPMVPIPIPILTDIPIVLIPMVTLTVLPSTQILPMAMEAITPINLMDILAWLPTTTVIHQFHPIVETTATTTATATTFACNFK